MKNSAAQKAFKIDLLLDLTESDDLTLQSQPYRTEFLLLSYSPTLRYVFYPSKFGAFYVYFQPVSPARTA